MNDVTASGTPPGLNTVAEVDVGGVQGYGDISDGYLLADDGLYYRDPGSDGDSVRMCGRLEITARTRDQYGGNHGRLLEWDDLDGGHHMWAMPLDMPVGDGLEVVRELRRGGLPGVPRSGGKKNLLLDYIDNHPVETVATCVDRTGWHGPVFVLPDVVLGEPDKERVVLQRESCEENIYGQQGALKDWQEHVAKYCIGNSRLIFAVSAAFAAPLMSMVGVDGCGFNFRGGSSKGKSTALYVATSVCGGEQYRHTWRGTSNGLEGTCANHNDSVLVLDEMGQVDPREAGEIAYMVANGKGKIRAGKRGNARTVKQWRTLLLSSGEISLADHMASAGKKVKAGQMVRLADIPADGLLHGAFEEIHEFRGGREFSDHLRQAAARYHGTAFRVFVEVLIADQEAAENCKKIVEEFVNTYVPAGADPQVGRVAGYFALVAAGGVLAVQYAVVGWDPYKVTEAVGACFDSWLKDRGTKGSTEDQLAWEQVVTFFQKHGQSRFARSEAEKVIDRAGFYLAPMGGQPLFLVFRAVFRKEVCCGLSYRKVLAVLKEKGVLVTNSGRVDYQAVHPGGTVKDRFYAIKAEVFSGELMEVDRDGYEQCGSGGYDGSEQPETGIAENQLENQNHFGF